MGSSTINAETIKRLASEVGEDTVGVLLTVFSDELEQYHATLSNTPTLSQIREISHSLKSSASSFGADELADMAQECESRVKQGQDSWVFEHLEALTQLVHSMADQYKALALEQNAVNSLS
ncbi:Hpt domain-containing protein [Thaumasiovibrio subtropicus]|uniref:Hpt domain-containing protein n=1 Tax=Thaumasiovibrio subtropicus TaxID=1891207 RepID=UPI000B3602E8|nr:Hpt domain-containing protein [Thaumasiovibrio subtropicus]